MMGEQHVQKSDEFELELSVQQLAAWQSNWQTKELVLMPHNILHWLVRNPRCDAVGVCAVVGCMCADDPGTPYSRRSDKSSSEPGDVELIERNPNDSSAYGEQCAAFVASAEQQLLDSSSSVAGIIAEVKQQLLVRYILPCSVLYAAQCCQWLSGQCLQFLCAWSCRYKYPTPQNHCSILVDGHVCQQEHG
jgi:hypothetical protein